jgi:hypothetical protein
MRRVTELMVGVTMISGTIGLPRSAVASAFDDYALTGSFLLPSGASEFGVLGDGRLITLVGAAVYEESTAGSRSFVPEGTLPGMDVPGYGVAFASVSPDGTRLAVGNNGGASYSNFEVGVFDLTTLSGDWYSVNHFDAAWYDEDHLALTAGEFGQPSVVTMLDVTSSAPGSPVNPTVIENIGGASAGVTFDAAGNLYTGNGYAGTGPSGTGTLKVFDAAAWIPALGGGPAVDFEADGTLIGDVLSANALGLDAEGNLHVGGGDFGGGDFGYAALIHASAVAGAVAGQGPVDTANPAQVRRFDPDAGSDFNFYDVDYNDVTGELYVREGQTVYVYAVPEPAAGLWLLVGAALALRRTR